jgi:hypothetical protein
MTYKQLAQLAHDVTLKTMLSGVKKYPDNDYMYRPIKEHRDHAHAHMRMFDTTFDRKELEHALTRIAIMLAKLRDENESKGTGTKKA